MLLLAIDTSTRLSSIALCSEDELYGEYTWQVGNNHSVELLENIRRLTTECQMTLQDVDAVAVATGPGSFNGVRVALATAKTLSFALHKPLIGVSTLDVVAAQQRHWRGTVCAVLEAGRSELYAACYLFEEERLAGGNLDYHMRRVSDYLLLTPAQVVAYLRDQTDTWSVRPTKSGLPSVLFCGEMSRASRQTLQSQMLEECSFADTLQTARRASGLAWLALPRLREGKVDDPLLLEPLYLRRPSITTSKRKQPLLGSTSTSNTDQSNTEREEGALRH